MKYTSEITVRKIQDMGGDHAVVAAARVSTSGEEALECLNLPPDESKGLIRYLMQHRHGTPFEQSALTFFIHAPIFVWREWHRHRVGFCLSGRSLIDCAIPSSRDRRQRTIEDLYRIWNYSPPNKKKTAKAIRLRCLNIETNEMETTRIKNVFSSGKKIVYKVVVGNKRKIVECSEDHRFFTPDGWKRLNEFKNNQSVITLRRSRKNTVETVKPSCPEEWKEYPRHDGYEVSTHGRVRSYLTKGSKYNTRQVTANVIKITKANRAVVNINGQVVQISRMVYETFNGVLDSNILVLHKDDNPYNNCLDNLYIGTDVDNKLDLWSSGGIYLRGCENKIVNVTRIGEEETYDIEVNHPHHNFIADSVVVHNSYNEESGRYKVLEPVFYIPPKDRPMFKVDGWKPGRPKFLPILNEVEEAAYEKLCNNLKEVYELAYTKYTENLGLDIDPGLARDCLPVGIYSSCWVTCNPRSLMHFLSLRTHVSDAKFISYPLYEIEIAARLCETIFAKGWPITYQAFCDFGRVAP